ncbi:MAG: NADH:ubiquinone reductase (Na(+)-transporting) subunit C [Candidatus Omnitrophica bacterium]|nr:NADH:ubiquinone reductase (Na(+)-transporting) subunit C [Candidatus Omnitrophota bacterium]
MMKSSNRYTFMFALIVCVVCSFSLAAVSEGLREKKELNEVLDIKKNILKAVALKDPVDPKAKPQEVLKIYTDKIEEIVIDTKGQIVKGKKPEDIKEGRDLMPLYIYKEDGNVLAYCFPIEGKGLWSTLYGYFALEPDATTVRGMTFYKHGETPGLGAEIEKEWFLKNFKGKQIWDLSKGTLTPVVIVKGKVADTVPEEQRFYHVDGISGATMTCKGVNAILKHWINKYEAYFSRIRKI